jgi:hypothetical protein
MKRYVSLGISKVRYDDKGRRIFKAEVYEINNMSLATRRIWSRENLVDSAELGLTIATIRIKDGYDFDILDAVEPVRLHGKVYLRVKGGEEPRDDLGELPSF